jgi:hypothetical protein
MRKILIAAVAALALSGAACDSRDTPAGSADPATPTVASATTQPAATPTSTPTPHRSSPAPKQSSSTTATATKSSSAPLTGCSDYTGPHVEAFTTGHLKTATANNGIEGVRITNGASGITFSLEVCNFKPDDSIWMFVHNLNGEQSYTYLAGFKHYKGTQVVSLNHAAARIGSGLIHEAQTNDMHIAHVRIGSIGYPGNDKTPFEVLFFRASRLTDRAMQTKAGQSQDGSFQDMPEGLKRAGQFDVVVTFPDEQ